MTEVIARGLVRDVDGPATPVQTRLTDGERRKVVWAGLLPLPLTGLVILPFVLAGVATRLDLVGGTIVYGGVLAVTAAVIAVDRLQARHCPRCDTSGERGRERCGACDYDLENQPRFACEERHQIYLEPGLCDCGRRLSLRDRPTGLGRPLVRMLWFGAWLLAFLIGVYVFIGITG